ncbi:hypothetical protein GCM10010498_34010 [Streptomyces cavourensis]|nr:hypothetical protein GCM10010498_34010 [Streptomyces cavourensis]
MSSRIPQPTPQYEQTVRTLSASALGPDVVPAPGPDVVPDPDVPAPGSASASDAVNETPLPLFPLSRPALPGPSRANTG